jgi:hypothetical protein
MMANRSKNPTRLADNLGFGEKLALIARPLGVSPFWWIPEFRWQALPLWLEKGFGTFQPGFDPEEVPLF